MKTILVATDFSPEASNATAYASHFAAATGAKIILFHLYHVSIHALNARVQSSTIDELKADSVKKLSDLAKKLSADYKIEVTPILKMGDFENQLQKTIDSTQADIVVMGMLKDSIEQDLLGNTTTAALQKLKFPVLAIPLNAKYKGLKTILFACDITRDIHKTILEKVKNIAVQLGAAVEMFHVSNKPDELDNEQKESKVTEHFADGLNGTSYNYKTVSSTAIIKAIHDEINQINADLLIMIPHKYGFWDSLIHISKTRMMASRSEIPLLSLPL
ncbi:universal stress protein [Flavobacterium aquicola]|uniref:Nucleotide-binding universal stress UspA family protein n=1 Tax=Flavobacterium aquicola TaxID=1682742 RepID=A0A3E0EQ56_9FLAO|nr:universal stress protein [Flavobacterium aquicola]REG99499.1 nucleotide-binding universal stress UspA family protein [Flavobacterium aquicola]